MAALEPLRLTSLDYQLETAQINIHNLRLRTYIGFNPEELSKQQDVIIQAQLNYRADEACSTDNEFTAVNYKTITKAIIQHVECGKFRLLEKLAADLLELAMENSQVLSASVTVDKPNALRFSDSVGITLKASRQQT